MRRHPQRYYRAHLPDGTHVKDPVGVACKRVIKRESVVDQQAMEPSSKKPSETPPNEVLQIIESACPPTLPRKAYDPFWLSLHRPEEAAAFHEWISRSPLVVVSPSPGAWLPSKRPGMRVDLVRATVPKEDAADRPLLDHQDALARRMILSVTGDE
jgi:hypothetical protein